MGKSAVLPKLEPELPFVFFPLHTEPKSSLLVEAQAADHQLAILNWLAKTVPAGWYVIVKEHPAQASARTNPFWEQVRRYPNVIVGATLERAEEYARRAKAVAVINSTVGIQAALAGTPVITFHKHYVARLMPHVLYADSYDTTVAAMRRVVNGELPAQAERWAAARAYLEAFAAFEFPIDDPALLAGRAASEALSAATFDTLYRKLLWTLRSVSAAQLERSRHAG